MDAAGDRVTIKSVKELGLQETGLPARRPVNRNTTLIIAHLTLAIFLSAQYPNVLVSS